jgi:hypothetical protein
MSARYFNFWLVILIFIALFPVDASNFARYVWLQIRLTIIDCYMFMYSYYLYLRLRHQGLDIPFRYKSIRDR